MEKQNHARQTQLNPQVVFEHMIQALNRHDLDAMLATYSPDYISEQPFHPERNFAGPAGVRKNWTFFFATIPDIKVDILVEAINGDLVWAEVHHHGTQIDGKPFSVRGVTISRIQNDQITWMRLYIEPAP